MKNYVAYSEDDFIMDPDFRKWVRHPDAETVIFWDKFLTEHPHKRPLVENAKMVLLSIVCDNSLLPGEKENMWNEIRAAIRSEKKGRLVTMYNSPKTSRSKWLYPAAAVIVSLIILTFIFLPFNKTPDQVVATDYGEIKQIVLPDSSFVTLNSNSNLKFHNQWGKSGEREVWIEGEAYFSVKHTSTNKRFLVHLETLDIEVLGTEFNVMQREGKLQVSLNSGTIKISSLQGDEKFVMKPGEIVELASRTFTKKSGRVEDISVWQKRKLVLDDTPFAEIMNRLTYIYGWEFQDVDPELLKEKLTGEIDTGEEIKLINTLEKALRIKINKQGNLIRIIRAG